MKPAKRLTRLTMMLCATLLASGCAAPTTGGNYCDIARPIWWDTPAQLDATPAPIVRQVVEHNETVAALCGCEPVR